MWFRTSVRPVWAPSAVAALAAGVCVASASPGVEKRGRVVNFLAFCDVSHTSNDDPIVHPREPGRSHQHTFFGNTSTDAFSTLRSLRAAGTTCGRRDETAAYWVPTLFKEGRPVRPRKATAYYQVRVGSDIRPYPPGLAIVAGEAGATRPQPIDVVWWNCGPLGGVRRSSGIPARCPRKAKAFGGVRRVDRGAHARRRPPSTSLELHVDFPSCWDGRRLDSPDHRSHLAYGRDWNCPRSHPVQLPRLTLIVSYPLYDGRGVTLSSGGPHTAHADFINAWQQQELSRIVSACTRGLPRCARKPG
jgi:Domain of unknown function (DUF1996)